MSDPKLIPRFPRMCAGLCADMQARRRGEAGARRREGGHGVRPGYKYPDGRRARPAAVVAVIPGDAGSGSRPEKKYGVPSRRHRRHRRRADGGSPYRRLSRSDRPAARWHRRSRNCSRGEEVAGVRAAQDRLLPAASIRPHLPLVEEHGAHHLRQPGGRLGRARGLPRRHHEEPDGRDVPVHRAAYLRRGRKRRDSRRSASSS